MMQRRPRIIRDIDQATTGDAEWTRDPRGNSATLNADPRVRLVEVTRNGELPYQADGNGVMQIYHYDAMKAKQMARQFAIELQTWGLDE